MMTSACRADGGCCSLYMACKETIDEGVRVLSEGVDLGFPLRIALYSQRVSISLKMI